MATETGKQSELVALGPVDFQERSLTARFSLKLPGGAHRMVKYTERKKPDSSIAFMGLEIDLGPDMVGNVFREGGEKSVGAVFMKQRGRSLPFGVSLGDAIRGHYSPALIEMFSEFLEKEGYTFAGILWEDALKLTGSKR